MWITHRVLDLEEKLLISRRFGRWGFHHTQRAKVFAGAFGCAVKIGAILRRPQRQLPTPILNQGLHAHRLCDGRITSPMRRVSSSTRCRIRRHVNRCFCAFICQSKTRHGLNVLLRSHSFNRAQQLQAITPLPLGRAFDALQVVQSLPHLSRQPQRDSRIGFRLIA